MRGRAARQQGRGDTRHGAGERDLAATVDQPDQGLVEEGLPRATRAVGVDSTATPGGGWDVQRGDDRANGLALPGVGLGDTS